MLHLESPEGKIKELRSVWEKNIGKIFEADEWDKIWSKNIKLMKATSYKESLYKMFLDGI